MSKTLIIIENKLVRLDPEHRGHHSDACPDCRHYRHVVSAYRRATGAGLREAVKTVRATMETT